jgi:phasin family protein
MSSPFDPTMMMEKLRDTFSSFGNFGTTNLPQLDMSGLMTAQKGMMEAVVAANQTMMEGLMALLQRQSEMMQETMQQAAEAAQTMGQTAGSPQDLLAHQVETTQQAFAKSVANARELSDMATKSYRDALDHVHGQITSQLLSIRDAMVTGKAKP